MWFNNSVVRVRFFRGFGFCLTLFCMPVQAGDTVYRCPDAEGQWQFQQWACQESDGEVIDVEAKSVIWKPVNNAHGIFAEQAAKRYQKPSKKKATADHIVRKGDKSCWRTKQRVERIEWKLRKGYKPAAGERMRQKRRELEAYLRRFCP